MAIQSPTSMDLEKARLGLLVQIDVPLGLSPGGSADGDRAEIRRLVGNPLQWWSSGLCPLAPMAMLDLVASTEAGKLQCLRSDVALISEVLRHRGDLRRLGAFGMVDTAFPVVIEDQVICCVWVRGYRTARFDEAEIEEIARTTGRSSAEVRQVADRCPRVDPVQEGRFHDLARSARDAVDQAVRARLDARALAHQAVQSERTRALGALSGGVAHRFNNLLSIILGYSSFVLNRERLSSEARDALSKISDAAQQGRRLTEEILSFAGSDAEQESPCHVHAVLSSLLSLLETQCSAKIRVRTELRASNDVVQAPPSSIHQLVFNLLSNAFDSLPEGGELEVRSRVAYEHPDGAPIPFLAVVVSDTGGAPSAKGDAPPGLEEGPGTRLKLSRADGIAGALQGSVSVRSRPDKGTDVEVRLPLASPEIPQPAQPATPKAIAPAEIWVVDDDPIFREMCREVLGEAGHRVEPLPAGRDLMERWAQADSPPDLLILDFSMPEYNGLELCTWLKEQGCESPIVLVSGFTRSQPDIHRTLEFRQTYFLRKPFSFRELLDTVTVALGASLIHDPAPSRSASDEP